jgi:hypothetical protein
MKGIIDTLLDPRIVKEIEYVPQSNRVDSRTFSRLLDDDKVVASYKMYWMLGILEEVSAGREEIEFKRIVSRMLVHAWYPILQYRLNFGSFDNLKKPVNYAAEKYMLASNCDERELMEFLYNNEDKELQRMMRELTNMVPYRLIAPFFKDELRGKKDHERNRIIAELSLSSDKCLYRIIKGDIDKIIINDGWAEYLKDNYRVIKSWIYYKLVCFLQKRNPNVPAVVFKLEAPKTRDLTQATKLWRKIIGDKKIKDIYTGKEFNDINYIEYGVLSIDHFIPWSFVLHDEMWNLVPTFKNINSKKNDKLLAFDNYIEDFCEVQYKAFSFICDKRLDSALEQYTDILRLDNPFDYCKFSSSKDFESKIRQCISPLYQIAVNQGFQVVERLF